MGRATDLKSYECAKCEFGYCAPLRCYCGHTECPAFASYIPRSQIKQTALRDGASKHARTWANREEATWLDRL